MKTPWTEKDQQLLLELENRKWTALEPLRTLIRERRNQHEAVDEMIARFMCEYPEEWKEATEHLAFVKK